MATKTKEFQKKPESEKRNPNTLRKVLYMIRKSISLNNISDFSRRSRDHSNRFGKDGLTTKAIKKIEADDIYIEYWQLEIYARMLGVPVGALLLFSRIKSDMEKSATKTSQTVDVMREILADRKGLYINDSMDIETLTKWCAAFRGTQSDLFSDALFVIKK